MTFSQQIITIALCSLATMFTRFAPFLLFSSKKPTPAFVRYLGKALPGAVFGLLVVYCLKNVSLLQGSHGIPEFLGILATVVLHLTRKNMLLSIAGGTVCYMVLLQFVF